MATQSVCDWCGHSIDGMEISLMPLGGALSRWPYQDLHRDCLAAIVTVLAGEDPPTAPKPNDALSRVQRENAAGAQRHRECWRDIGTHERERLIIEAIADDALTASEVANALSDTLGVSLYASHTRAVLNALHATGQLAKVTEIYRGKPRNRYRRPALDGPIADLQRALDDGVA